MNKKKKTKLRYDRIKSALEKIIDKKLTPVTNTENCIVFKYEENKLYSTKGVRVTIDSEFVTIEFYKKMSPGVEYLTDIVVYNRGNGECIATPGDEEYCKKIKEYF